MIVPNFDSLFNHNSAPSGNGANIFSINKYDAVCADFDSTLVRVSSDPTALSVSWKLGTVLFVPSQPHSPRTFANLTFDLRQPFQLSPTV
jgi:hypothetical protein